MTRKGKSVEPVILSETKIRRYQASDRLDRIERAIYIGIALLSIGFGIFWVLWTTYHP